MCDLHGLPVVQVVCGEDKCSQCVKDWWDEFLGQPTPKQPPKANKWKVDHHGTWVLDNP